MRLMVLELAGTGAKVITTMIAARELISETAESLLRMAELADDHRGPVRRGKRLQVH